MEEQTSFNILIVCLNCVFTLNKDIFIIALNSTYTSTCFHKNNRPKLVIFYLQPLEIVDQYREPSKKLGSQIEELYRCDRVMRTKSFWRLTRFRFSGPGHGQGRQNAPLALIHQY